MPIIKVETFIQAPIEKVFDMSRDIDLHKLSAKQTNEQAIAGVTSGLIGLNESVTWEAVHFGTKQRLTSKITKIVYPSFFQDEMVSGAFKSFNHEHHFETVSKGTKVTDIFEYVSPFGILGKFADLLFLKRYMTIFLIKRNQVLQEVADSYKQKKE